MVDKAKRSSRPITHSDWLAAIEELARTGRNDTGETTREISDRIGRCMSYVQCLLQKAKALGRLEIGRREEETIDGRLAPKTVYRILPAKKGKRK